MLVDVHICDDAFAKTYSLLRQIQLLRPHAEDGMNLSNRKIAKYKAQFTTKMLLNLFSYEFQNCKIPYAGEPEHLLYYENEYFCNVFVLRENPRFYQNILLCCHV